MRVCLIGYAILSLVIAFGGFLGARDWYHGRASFRGKAMACVWLPAGLIMFGIISVLLFTLP